MSKKIWFSILSAVLIAALGGAWLTADAHAQGGGLARRIQRLRPAIGQVTAVSADALTIQSLQGQALTFSLDERTNYRRRVDGQGEPAAHDDVQVGKWVSVLPVRQGVRRPAGGNPSARAVILLPEDLNPANAQVVRGRITAVDADRFTVETRRGETQTVLLDADTRYKGGAAGPADLKVGDAVLAIVEKQANGDLLAYSVRARRANAQPATR